MTEDRLTGDHRLSDTDLRLDPLGKIDIKTTTETDEPEAVGALERLTLLDLRHDPTRHQSGDLRHAWPFSALTR